MNSGFIICPGCGVSLPKKDGPLSPFNASVECWALYAQLSGYTLSLGDPEFVHQHAVDAYEAQHGGAGTKPIAVCFGLIGLFLACEKSYTGRQVQQAHMILANRNKVWPSLHLPDIAWKMTIADILWIEPGEARNAKIKEWMRFVWDGWKKDQQTIRNLTDTYLFH